MEGWASDATRSLIDFLARAAGSDALGANSYIVGGAVRDFLLGVSVKDVDVTVDSVQGGAGAVDLARRVADLLDVSGVAADAYGVVHIGPFADGTRSPFDGAGLSGQKVEIVTARRERYDKSRRTDSHKPVSVEPGTIRDDVLRRDFTVNALCWRLSDIARLGIDRIADVPVIDPTETGLLHLGKRELHTPLVPTETFSEDPTRILRGVRFAAKYGLTMGPDLRSAMALTACDLERLPYEAVDASFQKLLALPPDQMWRAFSDLRDVGALGIVRGAIPEGRLRRSLADIGSVEVELLLNLYGFPVPIARLPSAHVDWLAKRTHCFGDGVAASDSSCRDLSEARASFLRPPFDAERWMRETGESGKAVGEAIARARQHLLADPFVDPDELYRKVMFESISADLAVKR